METEVTFAIENEEQFWTKLRAIVDSPCTTHESIDEALRSFLAFTTELKETYLSTEYDLARCCYQLLESPIFARNSHYVRLQILYCLLQEDDVEVVYLSAAVLLYDGRANEVAYETMHKEGAFQRLVELLRAQSDNGDGLHRLLLELLFEMSRIQKLTRDDLSDVDDAFILHLFQLIEELSDDADDPYHYPLIRVILVLNEQYMCLANEPPSPNGTPVALTNRILKLLSLHGPSYRTFGENLILLLNRESELGPQLLILKLLYLLFTTPATFEYFYTNDLHVLVDVIIRNLLDLDPGTGELGLAADGSERDGQKALRHTYLRVLCPLLKNTQLGREDGNYKRTELRRLFYLLVYGASAHFAPVDETVIRLVLRCKQIAWLREEGDVEQDRLLEHRLTQVTPTSAEVAKKMLGMSIGTGSQSSLSVHDVSAKVAKQRPSVPAPRRNRKLARAQGQDVPLNGASTDTATLLKVPRQDVRGSDDYVSSPETRSPFADDNGEV